MPDPSAFRMLAVVLLLLTGCGQQPPDSTSDSKTDKAAPPVDSAPGDDQKVPDEPESKPAVVQAGLKTESDSSAKTKEAANSEKKRKSNRLARETSPYLLLHAHNPVDWYPWGPEAFEKAKREGKMIFLSIGYSSCYWCHVMERLIFENEEIAEYMNKHFVNVKVDREERPDVDDIYMTSLQVYFTLSRSPQGGGWPLSMFLTPDGEPIAGGTYFPPEDSEQRFGFPTVMRRMTSLWTEEKDEALSMAATITTNVKRQMQPRFSLESVPVERELASSVTSSVIQSHDAEYGGVDFNLDRPNAPKFPVPTKLALLQYEVDQHRNRAAETVLYHTLDAMADGGIRDHLAGGFHRYSTDRKWLIPHFEKMLYDNAQLADVYVAAYAATQKSEYRQCAEEILKFVMTDMTDRTGAFHSALDAETDEIEGKYYVWSQTEVEQALGDDAELFMQAYGMDRASPFEHGYVLHTPRRIADLAADLRIEPRQLNVRLYDLREKLLAIRDQRESPLKDDKILTSWNGLMIRAFANAAIVLNRTQYLRAAENAAMFILTEMRDEEGRLLRTYRSDTAKLNAYLDDYAFLIEGLLALHNATREDRWLNAARNLTDDQIRLFRDEKGKGFFFTSHHHEQLLARTKNAWDSVLPSGNSVSVRNLIRLASLTGEPQYREYAQEILELFAPRMKDNPRGMTNLAIAMGEFLDNTDYRPLLDRTNPRTASTTPPANPNPPPTRAKPQPVTTNATTPRTAKDRIQAKAFVNANKLAPGKSTRIAVVLDIDKDWHINTNPANPDFLVPTSISVQAKLGTKLANLKFPAGKQLKVADSPPYHVYDGSVTIIGELQVPEAAAGQSEEFELHIRYQACNDKFCDRPRTLKFAAQLPVAEIGEEVQAINESIFEK